MSAVVRTPDARFEGLPDHPFSPRYVEIDGLRIHRVDEGEGAPVVLFHGEPTWSFLYRKMIPPLVGAGYRCIAPDYAGFGRSDKPTDPEFYTYDRHVAIMQTLFERLDLHGATAVVQDWGGPIGLRCAVEMQDRFDRVVVMNTGLSTGRSAPSEGFMKWLRFVERPPDLPIGLVMARSAVTDWPAEVIAGYEAPFPDVAHKTGAQRFPLIVPLEPTAPGADAMRAVVQSLREWTQPALVLFSAEDPIFSPAVGEAMAKLIPGAGDLQLVENAGHFLQEDQGETVAARIIDFLAATD